MGEYQGSAKIENGSFEEKLRYFVNKRIEQGASGIGDYNAHTGKVNNAITETKNYWMDENVFDWCCQHHKRHGVPPEIYAAVMCNTIKHGNEFMMPSAFRVQYARQKLDMAGLKLTVSERLKP